ncbi:MAG: macro domain-containing protein, partial [Endomicrobium sp.]|nr:macro domain-containing protein [Endomicrobium sp.]
MLSRFARLLAVMIVIPLFYGFVSGNSRNGAEYNAKEGRKKQVGKTEIVVLKDAEVLDLGGKVPVDAIVNPANCRLQWGPGISEFIFTHAGDELQQECDKFKKISDEYQCQTCENSGRWRGDYRCHTGGAKVTDALDLRKQGIKWIVHAVGPNLLSPNWGNIDKSGQHVCYGLKENRPKAREALKDAYTSALSELKKEHPQARSIAFHCISTNISQGGYPKDEAAVVALEAVQEYVKNHPDDYDKIILACTEAGGYCYEKGDYEAYISLPFFGDSQPIENGSLNKALKMNYKVGFVGNMLRSVCNGNSCGEEVFREMSIGGLVRGEGEVLKK